MVRKCRPFNVDAFLREFPQFRNVNIKLWIDIDNGKEIMAFLKLQRARKKFKMILYAIFSNYHNEDLYGYEKVSGKAKDIKAMKFKGSSNERIYCKEFSSGGKKIVMITLYAKKSQKNNKAIKNILETIGGYEYDFQE